MNKPRKPRGLDAAGTRLWEQVLTVFDLSDDPHKLALLEQACRVSDQIVILDREAAKQPLTVLGSARQKTINPLRSEARFQRGLLAQLLKSLELPATEEEVAERAAIAKKQRADAGRSARLRLVADERRG